MRFQVLEKTEERILINLIRTLNLSLKTRKSLVNQGFITKKQAPFLRYNLVS